MAKKTTLIESGKWYKGNTHLHTTFSDGKLGPEEVADIYRSAGYSFVAITDHWHYGNHRDLGSDGFLVFTGMEMDLYFNPRNETGICHHVTVLGNPEETPFKTGDRFEELHRAGNMVRNVEYFNKNGHLCIYAHPTWSHIKMEEYDKVVSGCVGVEIYNHACEYGDGCGYAEANFNRGLWEYRHKLCFACDDSHERPHFLGGFICVKAAALTYGDILEAIRAGSFYASNGPEIYDFYLEDGQAYLECSPCSDICFFTDAFPGAHPVKNQPGTTCASYTVPKGAKGIYALCRDGLGKAWTQIIPL